jgi:pyruvate kinase
MSAAACTLVEEMPVKAIVGLTMTGNTARLVSRLRPKVPIFAITPQESSYRRMNLLWGVKPLKGPYTDRLIKLSRQVHEELLKRNLAELDDMVVLIGGHPLATLGSTNFVKAVRVGDMNPRTSGQEGSASPKE